MGADEIVAFQPENKILNKLKDENDEDDEDDEENQVAEPDEDSDKTIEILQQDEEYDERNELVEADEENYIIKSDEENDQENKESVKPDDESNEKNELLKADDDTLNDMVQEAKTAGDYADLFGTNQHYNIPDTYQDFGRRFVLNYPYFEKKPTSEDAAETELDNAIKQHLTAKKLSDRRLLPHKAPPEFVLAIAKQSVLLESMKPKKPTHKIKRKDILRTGDYWNDVWKEDVDVNKVLRSSNTNQNELESVRVKISPGSKLYDLFSILQKKSPRLLYVINKRNYE
nr:serine/threonine-protein kinase rio2-like [Vanessa tameamea]